MVPCRARRIRAVALDAQLVARGRRDRGRGPGGRTPLSMKGYERGMASAETPDMSNEGNGNTGVVAIFAIVLLLMLGGFAAWRMGVFGGGSGSGGTAHKLDVNA